VTQTAASTDPLPALAVDAHRRGSGRGWLADLNGEPTFGHVGPNWFAAVMGTGIVANAAATLPIRPSWLLDGAQVIWVLDAALLVLLVVATAVHWLRHAERARLHLGSPVMSHFYGAPAMALMTVGAGATLVGQDLVGPSLALIIDAVLWTAGTMLGLWTAVAIPLRMFTRHTAPPDAAFGGWLMPVVPPMVSAALGALLIPHLPPGQAQFTLLALCYAMFGLALIASLVMITLIWNRLTHHALLPAVSVPTLWIVLGPLGQSITATHTLGAVGGAVLPQPYAEAFEAFGLVYGLPVWGFALLWAAIAVGITAQAVRRRMPFALTWWSFTFPVGTVVTGTSGLAAATGLWLFDGAAVLFYLGLLAAWLVVFVRTARGVWTGSLLRAA
jgi:C4-dicarboxylate transporter/malic acid transport protein